MAKTAAAKKPKAEKPAAKAKKAPAPKAAKAKPSKLKAVAADGERKISRQALWQRKQREKGLCVLCSEPVFKGWRCAKHYEHHKIQMRLRYIPTKRGRYSVGSDKPDSEKTPVELVQEAAKEKRSKLNKAAYAKRKATAEKKTATVKTKKPSRRK